MRKGVKKMRLKKKKYVWAFSNAVFVNENGESIFLETGKEVPVDKIPGNILEAWKDAGAVKEERNGADETD
jgi:hypothetical protein